MSAFARYAQDNPPLEKQKLHYTILKFQETKDDALLEIIYKSTSRFLFKQAAKYARAVDGITVDDLMSSAYYAVKEAASNFDPDRNIGFLTYVAACARSIFWKECNTGGIVYIPRRLLYARYALKSSNAELRLQHEVYREKVEALPSVFLESALLSDEDSFDEVFQLYTEKEDPEAYYIKQIEHVLSRLENKEQAVVSGVLNGMTSKEIGQNLGVTRQRVDQILAEAYKKIFALEEVDNE